MVAKEIIARAIASLEKKAALRRVRWKETCVAERAERAQRAQLSAFVERYLKLRDNLAKETAEWDAADRNLYIYTVLREMRRRRSRTR